MYKAVFFILIVLIPDFCIADIIDVNIKGRDDGVKTSQQKDYKEAVLFAKREAIERAGVKIKSMTTVKDMVVNSDYIESKAEAALMPGYNIVDIGYTADGTYQIVLIGKVKIEKPEVKQQIRTDPVEKTIQPKYQYWKISGMNRSADLTVDSAGKFTGMGWKGNAPGCGDYDIPISNGKISGSSVRFDINASYCGGQGEIQGSCSGNITSAASGSGECSGSINDRFGARDFNFPWTMSK